MSASWRIAGAMLPPTADHFHAHQQHGTVLATTSTERLDTRWILWSPYHVTVPNKFLLEGLDRLGKDTLLQGIQDRLGYHQVLHFGKPAQLECYRSNSESSPERLYQEASFRNMFRLLSGAPNANIICNRAHLGECVYAPIYRGYSGEYVFDIENEFKAHELPLVRLILLIEDFELSRHFVDDGRSSWRC